MFCNIKYPGNNDDCWFWTGILFQGTHEYGIFNLNNKHFKAHRIIYECYNGPIQNNLMVCHKCDIPQCVNPNHLFLGTNDDNIQDMVNKNRQAKGSSNGMSKLDESDIIEILENIENGTYNSISQICSIYGISESPIHDIFSRRLWHHVTSGYSDSDLLLLKSMIKTKPVSYALTKEDAIVIKNRLNNNNSLSSIARDYMVSTKTIYNIKIGKIWKTV